MGGEIQDAHHNEKNHYEQVNPGVWQIQVSIMMKDEYYRRQQADLCCAVELEHLSLDNLNSELLCHLPRGMKKFMVVWSPGTPDESLKKPHIIISSPLTVIIMT